MADRRAGREPGAAVNAPLPGLARARRARAALPLAAGLLAAALVPGAAGAGPVEAIAGWEGDTFAQGYGFVTLGVLVPAGTRVEFPVRLTGSYLVYRFDSTGIGVRVSAPGASLLAGPRVTGPGGSFAVLAGGEVRRERREYGAGGGPARERTVGGFVAQLEGDAAITPRWHAGLLASYGGAAEYVYTRGSLRCQLNNLDWQGPAAWFAGVEGVVQGNSDSRGWQAGAFAECALVPQHVSLGLHAGYKEGGSGGSRHFTAAYTGVSLYRRF